jgi:hypothetical protein
MEPVVRGKGPEGNASVAARKRFGRYKEEGVKKGRAVQLDGDRTLRLLKGAWMSLDGSPNKCVRYERVAEEIDRVLAGIRCSREDVERFSFMLVDFQEELNFQLKVGFYISALINNGLGHSYRVPVDLFDEPISHLGYRNSGKEIIIRGDVGGWVGAKMTAGVIRVCGDAAFFAGGTMAGGTLIIEGNAPYQVGSSMEGGEIRVEGEKIGKGYRPKRGRIYHKGKLIVDK